MTTKLTYSIRKLPSDQCEMKSDVVVAIQYTGLILGLRPANERRRYKVTPSLIGWAQT